MAEPVSDPTKPHFWRLKNIVLLASSAIVPLLFHSVWTWAADRIKDFDEVRDRLKELEVNTASRNAIWGAINEVKSKQTELDLRVTVAQRLFDREWGRGSGVMEKEHVARISKAESELYASQRAAISKLVDVLNRDVGASLKIDDLVPPKAKPKWTDFSQFMPDPLEHLPVPAPSAPAVDPDKLREQYEQKFPPTKVPNQQRK
jgi:hypothetical protein